MAHQPNRVYAAPAPMRKRCVVMVLRTITSSGVRLGIDRETQAHQHVNEAPHHESAERNYVRVWKDLLTNFDWYPGTSCISGNQWDVEDVIDPLCDAFIMLTRAAAEKRWNYIFRQLRTTKSQILQFLDRLRSIEDIRGKRRAGMKLKTESQVFSEQEFRGDSGLPTMCAPRTSSMYLLNRFDTKWV